MNPSHQSNSTPERNKLSLRLGTVVLTVSKSTIASEPAIRGRESRLVHSTRSSNPSKKRDWSRANKTQPAGNVAISRLRTWGATLFTRLSMSRLNCWERSGQEMEPRTWAIPILAIPLIHLCQPEDADDILLDFDRWRTNLAKQPFWGSRFGLTVFDALWAIKFAVEYAIARFGLLFQAFHNK